MGLRTARFDRQFLELLNEDELSLLYMLYHKIFQRTIDLRCVFVQPVLNRIKQRDDLNEEGVQVRNNIIEKAKHYYDDAPTFQTNAR
jgi:hypothetical protein